MKIAVTGKGGVGKTTIAATLARLYAEEGHPVLACLLYTSLLAAGVPEKQIHLPNLCTCCNPDFLYSHRASKGKRGNLAAFLSLV